MNTEQVLLIGIDAVSNSTIETLMSAGKLPNLTRLQNQGWSSKLANEGLSGAVWPSLYTGSSMSSHGHYFFNQLKTGTYQMSIEEEGAFNMPCFWERLSDAEKRVAVIDAPKTKLYKAINGMQVINWATHDPDAFNPFDATPQLLRQEIAQQYPDDPIGKNDWGGRGPADITRFKHSIIKNINRRTKLTLDFLHKEKWNLFFTVFDDAHQLGHLAWHLHDKNHPRWNLSLFKKHGDPIDDIYIEIDRAIGEIISTVDKNTTIVVFNSLGMGPNYHNKSLIECFLKSMDNKLDSTKKNGLYTSLSYLWRHIPLVVHRYLWKFQLTVREGLLSNKRSESLYFFLPLNEDNDGIRINLQGREPNGKVAVEDYDAICKELIDELKTINDPDTGKLLVKKIVVPHKKMRGERLNSLPDIIIEWDIQQSCIKAKWSRGEFEFKAHEWRTGSHQAEGFIIAKGKNFTPATKAPISSIMDIAPTLYAIFGLDDIETDGNVLKGYHK